MKELHIFGYGSLMWRPGFEYESAKRARLPHYRRVINVQTTEHRGSDDTPGLVFNLERANGAFTDGIVYTVAPEKAEAVSDYLSYRERITMKEAYEPLWLRIAERMTRTYWVPKEHTASLDITLEQAAPVIANAYGTSGDNTEYVMKTWEFLQQNDMTDQRLQRLVEMLK